MNPAVGNDIPVRPHPPTVVLNTPPRPCPKPQRVSYVWIKGRYVAYPFQNNIAALDKDDQVGGWRAAGVAGVPG